MTAQEIAYLIRELVFETNRSQCAIAEECGVDHRTINGIVNGVNLPKLDTAIRILDALGYKLEVVPK